MHLVLSALYVHYILDTLLILPTRPRFGSCYILHNVHTPFTWEGSKRQQSHKGKFRNLKSLRSETGALSNKEGYISTVTLAVSILEDALSVWTNLGKHLLFVWLCVSIVRAQYLSRPANYFSLCVLKAVNLDMPLRRIMTRIPEISGRGVDYTVN